MPTVKRSGGLFEFGHSTGGVLERGAYLQNPMIWIRMMAFQFIYSIFCGFNVQFYESNTEIEMHQQVENSMT